jgi:hypothetical protein
VECVTVLFQIFLACQVNSGFMVCLLGCLNPQIYEVYMVMKQSHLNVKLFLGFSLDHIRLNLIVWGFYGLPWKNASCLF